MKIYIKLFKVITFLIKIKIKKYYIQILNNKYFIFFVILSIFNPFIIYSFNKLILNNIFLLFYEIRNN